MDILFWLVCLSLSILFYTDMFIKCRDEDALVVLLRAETFMIHVKYFISRLSRLFCFFKLYIVLNYRVKIN